MHAWAWGCTQSKGSALRCRPASPCRLLSLRAAHLDKVAEQRRLQHLAGLHHHVVRVVRAHGHHGHDDGLAARRQPDKVGLVTPQQGVLLRQCQHSRKEASSGSDVQARPGRRRVCKAAAPRRQLPGCASSHVTSRTSSTRLLTSRAPPGNSSTWRQGQRAGSSSVRGRKHAPCARAAAQTTPHLLSVLEQLCSGAQARTRLTQ